MKNREELVNLGLLCVRIILGVIFIAHGSQKLFGAWGGSGIDKFAENLQKMDVPAPTLMAYVAASSELGGGLLVLLGLFARIGALAIAGVMIVAILKVHLRNGFFAPPGFEYPLALLGMALAILLAGPGEFSIQRAFTKRSPKQVP
jgi:putative oxidoreductase